MLHPTFPLVADRVHHPGPAVPLSGDVLREADGPQATQAQQVSELLLEDLNNTLPPASGRSGVPVILRLAETFEICAHLPACQEPFQQQQGYLLQVSAKSAVITATTRVGLIHGCQTLLQLLRSCPERTHVPPLTIADAPRMPERGQMIDVGRKYLPVDVLRAEIRRMAWWKMNSLHLHLSEWNGFRINSQVLPGVASPEAYSLAELQELDAYAQSWGVQIIPELEFPGHAVWLSRYDERLRFRHEAMDVSCYPGGQAGGWMLDITSEHVRDTVKNLLSEVCSVFSSPVIHIGGDELPNSAAFDSCPELVEYAAQGGLLYPTDVVVEFTNDLADHLASLGRVAEVWEWCGTSHCRTSIPLRPSIRLSKWLPDSSPTFWAEQGRATVGVNWNNNFATPGYSTSPGDECAVGFEGYMPAESNYAEDNYPHGGKVMGYRMGRWMDRAEHRSYEWVDFYARRGLQVIAERTWSLFGDKDATSAFERADAVGAAPSSDPASALVALTRQDILEVAASSDETDLYDGRADHLIDRKRHTTWTSRVTRDMALPPHEITITLNEEQLVAGLDITPRLDGLTIEQYHGATGVPRDISVWLGTNTPQESSPPLVDVCHTTLGPDLITQRITFEPTPARVVRVVIHTEYGNLMLAALSGIDVLVAPTPTAGSAS